MTRTRLLNKYRKDNSAGNLFFYKRQVFSIKDNFTGKTLKDERITLVEGGQGYNRRKKDVVELFRDHFEKIVETLKIDRLILSGLGDDPVLNTIGNFSHHTSVLKIKEQETLLIAFPLNWLL